ncbi:MAG: efflux transporter outer membrane subunit [Burkholderiaceae bacterium]|nr:efflux transporter outer membrane subunit [Burkholderiaceae bacterium]
MTLPLSYQPRIKLALVILTAGSLAACAAISPGVSTVQPLQAEQLGLQAGDIAWPSEHWWDSYNDPQLKTLVTQALAGSPRLDAAQARLVMAQAASKGARAVQLPQLNAAYTMTRERFSENYIYPPPYAGSMQTDNALNLNLSLDLDLWGKKRALFAAATSQQLAAQADLAMARSVLTSAVVQSYFSLQNALAQESVTSQIVKQLEDVLDITQQRVAAGLDTEVEINQARSALASAKVQLSQARTNSELLHNQLATLQGLSPKQLAPIHQIEMSPLVTAVPDQLAMNLLGRRADIVAAKYRVLAGSQQISAAKADFYPNINLSAFVGFSSLGVATLLQSTSLVFGAGPAISLPIFHGGALNAQLQGKRAERDLAIADYNQTLLNAVREVSDATTSLRGLQQQSDQQAISLQAIRTAYDIAVQRYKAGLGNFVQVLLAQNEVQKQSMLATDIAARAYQLDAQLATALGGGYQATPVAENNTTH